MEALKNTFPLPVEIGGRKYPTTEHYALSSLIQGQDNLASYPLGEARVIFNRLDEEQYIRTLREACDEFNEKKCRSTQPDGKHTIGHNMRSLLAQNNDFVCVVDANSPFRSVVSVEDFGGVFYGYNLIGLSLLRTKRILAKLPPIPGGIEEVLFWKAHPDEEVVVPTKAFKTHKTIIPRRGASAKAAAIKAAVAEEEAEDALGFFYEPDDDDDERVEDETGFYPDEVPIYTDKRVRWVATGANSRLDDLRSLGIAAEMMRATEVIPTNPFRSRTPLATTDPHHAYRIYRAADYLVARMENGSDIKEFLNEPVDTILARSGIFATNTPPDFWDAFTTKTVRHYRLIEDELFYPQNLAGFVRKAHADKLNASIGKKIREILFASFTYQVIEKYYPDTTPGLRVAVMKREMDRFSPEEYENITDKLYNLYFKKKFALDEEGARRIADLEMGRLTQDEISNALRFVPRKNTVSTPCLDTADTVLDPSYPVRVRINGKDFYDLYQYAYYRVFLLYGAEDAYDMLFHNGEMSHGDDPRLAGVLAALIERKRDEHALTAIRAKHEQHPRIQELVAYARSINHPFDEEDELWSKVEPQDFELMKWVVSITQRDLEKSVRLFSFIRDVAKSMIAMKSLTGKRLRGKQLGAFVMCFYPKLATIVAGDDGKTKTQPPKPFASYMEGTNAIAPGSVSHLWSAMEPFVRLFRNKSFDPAALFREAKSQYPSATLEDAVRALSGVVKCLYKENEEVPNDHFFLIAQIMSGQEETPTWPDPSYEMVMETTEDDDGPDLTGMPEAVRKKFPKRKRKTKPGFKKVRHDVFHPLTNEKMLRQLFGDKNAARASYASHSIYKNAGRRIGFYL